MLRGLLPTLLVLAMAAVATPARAGEPPVRPVPSVDLERYTGTWYQLAAIPQWFNLACVRDTSATYTAQADGTIGVRNRCTGPFGGTIAIDGRARVNDPDTNAQLQVTFVRVGDRWLYIGSTNYIIIGLADDYSWAVVTDPLRSSGFVLSRTPSLPGATINRIQAVLRANGVDPCRLRVTPVTGGATGRGRFC